MDFEIGQIVLWFGSIASIPAGWTLCDGTAGTPDLRSVFVIGAGGGFPVDDTGGTTLHIHSFTGDGHSHQFIQAGPANKGLGGASPNLQPSPATGNTLSANIRSPFHGLAYIQAVA